MVKNKTDLKNPVNEKINYDTIRTGEETHVKEEYFSRDLSSHPTGKEAYEHDRKLKDDPEGNFTPISVIEKKNILEKRDK